jgi:hypothetical protein
LENLPVTQHIQVRQGTQTPLAIAEPNPFFVQHKNTPLFEKICLAIVNRVELNQRDFSVFH